jgi:hypothetical protein
MTCRASVRLADIGSALYMKVYKDTGEIDRDGLATTLARDGSVDVSAQFGPNSTSQSGSRNRRSMEATPARIFFLRKRNLKMLKKDLILRNPLSILQREGHTDTLAAGNFGAVLARAGVGKTALLVQISLNSLLEGKNVLHISLTEPVQKVSLWYDEVFSHISRQYNIQQSAELWQSLLPHRFIMTFRVEGFSVPKLEERLTDLTEQNIFSPHMLIIDGLPFEDSGVRDLLTALKSMALRRGVHVWFTVRTHREDPPVEGELPRPLSDISELFDAFIKLQPVGGKIHIRALTGSEETREKSRLQLDPETLLIVDAH